MNNFIYIGYFDELNYYDSIALANQINNTLNSKIHCVCSSIDVYNFCKRGLDKKNILRVGNKDENISNLVDNYSNKNLVLLHNTALLFNKNFLLNLNLENNILHRVTYNGIIAMTIINFETCISLIRKNIAVKDILNEQIENSIVENKKYSSENHGQAIYLLNKTIEKPNKKNNIIYSDNNCLFVILENSNGVAASPAYINKKNMKAYHINNTIVGNVLSIQNSAIDIVWQIDNRPILCEYR